MFDGDTVVELDAPGDTVAHVEHEPAVELAFGWETHCVVQVGHVALFACLLLLHHYHVH